LTSTLKLGMLRDQFLSDGFVELSSASSIRPDILKSWKRSRLSGAHITSKALPFESPNGKESLLLRAADPVLSRLSEELAGQQASILIANARSLILRTWTPDKNFDKRMEAICSMAGFSGSEELVGTNGIGTIIEERRPLTIVGAEHFSDFLTDFTCVGAPIHHPITGRFQGGITLTAMSKEVSPLLQTLLNQTAREIGQQLLAISSQRERVLLDAFVTAARVGRAIGVVGNGIFVTNTRASDSLRRVDQTLLWMSLSEALSEHNPEHKFSVRTEDSVLGVIGRAVFLNNHVIGAVLEADETTNFDAPRKAKMEGVQPREKSLIDLLPGTSPAWLSLVSQAELAVKFPSPVTAFGEPGTGRLTLLRAMIELARPGEVPVIIDCAQASSDPSTWNQSLLEAFSGTKSIVLRHLDRLDSEAATFVAGALASHPEVLRQGRAHGTSLPKSTFTESDSHESILRDLSVVRLNVPSLSERREDISAIVTSINLRFYPSRPFTFAPSAYAAILRSVWPCNIKDLESFLRGIFAVARKLEITTDMLPPRMAVNASKRSLTMMEQLEVTAILNAITQAEGNKVLAAQLIGVSRSTLYRKIRTYKLDDDVLFAQ
jgi:transcriptional regulator of acetoin/glycerol metabolism